MSFNPMYSSCSLLLFVIWFAAGCGMNQDTASDPSGQAAQGSTTDERSVKPPPADPVADDLPTNHPPSESSSASDEQQASTNANLSAIRAEVAKVLVRDEAGWQIDASVKQALEDRGIEVVERVWSLLDDQSVDVRRGAAFLLNHQFDPSSTRDVATFKARLADPDPSIRHVALQVIKRLSTESLVEVVDDLASMFDLEGESAANRAEVARMLGRLKDKGRSALAVLTKAIRDDANATVRKACLFAVSQIAEPNEFVPVCRTALRDDDAGMRRQAAMRLSKLGPDAAPAANQLADGLEDEDEDVRQSARDALINIGQQAVDPLVAKLDAKSATTRALAVYALGKLGPNAKSALPALEKRLQDEDSEVRELTNAVIRYIRSGG